MLTAHLAKSIIRKSLFTKAITSVYSSSNQDRQQNQTAFEQKRPQRQLKPYEKLFFSSPIMNINIEMIMAINQLRPKATYIIANKNAYLAKQITNSTYNIIECLSYIQGFKYFYKAFPSLSENIARVLKEKIEFSATGIYKPNSIKKLVLMLSNIDSLYGESFVQCMSVFLIWALQSSIKTKHVLTELMLPLKSRLQQVKDKRKSIADAKRQQDLQTLKALDQQIYKLQDDIKKVILKNRFIKEEDFLCGLHYCLQRGYYSETVIKEFVSNILEKDNYNFPDFEAFLNQEENFFQGKPLSGIFNRKAMIYCRMYSNVIYRIKILNELKKMKLYDPKFMDFIKKIKKKQQPEISESLTDDSPFIDGKKIEDSSSDSQSEQKSQKLDFRLVEQSLIPKKAYLNLVSAYIQLLQRKDVLCFILSEENGLQSFRIMQTEFFSYLNDDTNKSEGLLTFREVKKKYLNLFTEIFNIEKYGYMYAESNQFEGAFEIILRMYDYNDRKEVYELLRLYERYLLSKDVENIKTLAPFYVFEKYGYQSNFVASKLFEYINSKYRTREDSTFKEDLIINSLDICRYLCLYFKLVEGGLPSLFSHDDLKKEEKKNSVPLILQEQQKIHLRQQVEFPQAIEIFLHNYNKLISVVYLERQNSGFIGKGLKLSYDYLKTKYFMTRQFESGVIIQGKEPEENILKIMQTFADGIKSHRSYVKNLYEKQILIDSPLNKPTLKSDSSEAPIDQILETFDLSKQCMMTKKNSLLSPLDQVSTILEIVQTAVQLQVLKNIEFYEDVFAVLKNIYENQKLRSLLTQQPFFPEIFKRIIRITQILSGSNKNQSDELLKSFLKFNQFNLNDFLLKARIDISRQFMNVNKSVMIDEAYQPYMHTLVMNAKVQRNIKIWPIQTYKLTKENMVLHIRSDILHVVLLQSVQFQKTIRDELARIKTVKPNDIVKNMKLQLNYLEYPYFANLAINKVNETILIFVRKQTAEGDKPQNAVLNRYYEECENYYKRKGNKVVVITNQNNIRSTIKELIK